MILPARPTESLSPAQLADILASVQAQVIAALWLSAGMGCALAMISAVALGWRRPALVAGLCYSLTLCFLAQSRAQTLGPCGCAISLTGFLWPRRPARPGGPPVR
jgi:hypothetical protein